MSNEELVKEIQSGNDVQANLAKLFEQNIGMIRKQAAALAHNGEEEDLVQEGFFGLRTAAYKYDSKEDVSFMTYALYWIRQSMFRYQKSCGSVIRLPDFRHDQIYHYQQFVTQYREQHGADPDLQTICKALKISDQVLTSIDKCLKQQDLDSLDAVLPGTDSLTLADTVTSEEDFAADETDQLLLEEIKKKLWENLDRLKEQQKTAVVEMIMKCRTAEEIAKDMNISFQRICQLKTEGIKQIRKSKDFPWLQEAAFDLYGLATRGVGAGSFFRTWSSTTERAALHDLQRQEVIRKILQESAEHTAKTASIMDALQNMDRSEAEKVIRLLVPDPELSRILIARIVDRKSYSELRRAGSSLKQITDSLDTLIFAIGNMRRSISEVR